MDFIKIKERSEKKDKVEVYPDFVVKRSEDLMVRGKAFYSVWDPEVGLWSRDEFDIQRLVDKELRAYREKMRSAEDSIISVKYLSDFSTGSWRSFKNYLTHLSDSYKELDEQLTFANTEVKKESYVSKRLPYPLQGGSITAYEEIISTLYDPEERDKLEWAIGAIIAGDSRYIQKFVVLYGPAGAGKSTILKIIEKLFEGYYTTFEAKALTSSSNAFSTEVFRTNPLVAIQHDGDLSKIEDNTKLNSIVSHEEMTMNEKFKSSYQSRINAFLFMGTNKPVKITDAKSGIIRRLIDVQPSGRKLPERHYHALMNQIDFEMGAIAQHCLDKFRSMGRDYYSGYRPVEMMLQTDVFFNFIEAHYDIFKRQDGTSLKQAYELYKVFCDETNIEYKLAQYRFREELKNYFIHYNERATIDGERIRNWYSGFVTDRFVPKKAEEHALPIILDKEVSLLDGELANQPAQYATRDGIPGRPWDHVTTTLSEIDTAQEHYVRPPLNHIVIDFDLKDDAGEKSPERNMEAASKWPPTYAEYSKSGGGLHLHYNYDGDVSELSNTFAQDIEIKVFRGNASLRRRLSKCNDIPIATINSGIPLKEKKVIGTETIKSVAGLRRLIEKNLRKEIHPGTRPSVDFIKKILDDAYASDLVYDVTDLRGDILAFASGSTHQAEYCVKLIDEMKFKSKVESYADLVNIDDLPVTVFDVECFPNLFMISYKTEGMSKPIRMYNPNPRDVETLLQLKLVGFNNRRYDNHMLYAAMMGYDNEALYTLSQRLIDNSIFGAQFGEAYNLSYADIYDYASKKQSLKKWQIEMGVLHMELGLPWDQPVPEKLWELVGEYCDNDVDSTLDLFYYTSDDFNARKILAALSGLSVNDTTAKHTAKILFNGDRRPQEKFIYTDLATGKQYQGTSRNVTSVHPVNFEGYTFERNKSMYKGVEVGEGGYVYAEPGMYENVVVLDIASMHPTSIEQLDLFGPYTKNFTAIKNARVLIKRGDLESAGKMMGGVLKPFLASGDADKLAYALKIVINTVYGMTAAKFDNPFRDVRNKDNIVAKRGALFMVDLKEFVEAQGYQVVHIKTDSIKIPNADTKIIEMVMEFGQEYGYEFEHEVTYKRFCLVNNAVYIAKAAKGRTPEHWEAVGAQFQHPYIFKSLFSNEELEDRDYAETKAVQKGAIYMNPNTEDTPMAMEEDRIFVGKVGQFVPVKEGGYTLERVMDDKYYAVAGTKGYRWMLADYAFTNNVPLDMGYYQELIDEAIADINKYGDFARFVSSEE